MGHTTHLKPVSKPAQLTPARRASRLYASGRESPFHPGDRRRLPSRVPGDSYAPCRVRSPEDAVVGRLILTNSIPVIYLTGDDRYTVLEMAVRKTSSALSDQMAYAPLCAIHALRCNHSSLWDFDYPTVCDTPPSAGIYALWCNDPRLRSGASCRAERASQLEGVPLEVGDLCKSKGTSAGAALEPLGELRRLPARNSEILAPSLRQPANGGTR